MRLAPARLTHCMRWLGAARRSHEIAVARSVGRELFGGPLADHGMAQQLIADNEIDLAAARALLWQTCWQLAPVTGAARALRARRCSSARRPAASWTAASSCAAASAPARTLSSAGSTPTSGVPDIRRRVGGAPHVDRETRGAKSPCGRCPHRGIASGTEERTVRSG